jgi:hypothetical protein
MSDPTSPTDEAPRKPEPFISCSECKTPMRKSYYALNDRPICGKCRMPYAKTIEASEGKGAFARVLVQGAIIAVVGAAVLAFLISILPPLKILVVVPIGWLIGKRIISSVDNYSSAAYQKLAVGLTYFSLLAGMSIGAVRSMAADTERRAEVRTKMQGTAATQDDAIAEEMKSMRAADSIEAVQNGEAFDPDEEPDTGMVFTGDAELDSAMVRERENARRQDSAARVNVAKPPSGPGSGLLMVMFLLTPFFGMLGGGMALSAVGVAAAGYSLYLAWKLTDPQGRDLQLSGPYKVGEGPIAPNSPGA